MPARLQPAQGRVIAGPEMFRLDLQDVLKGEGGLLVISLAVALLPQKKMVHGGAGTQLGRALAFSSGGFALRELIEVDRAAAVIGVSRDTQPARAIQDSQSLLCWMG